jgi:hypothetical protein
MHKNLSKSDANSTDRYSTANLCKYPIKSMMFVTLRENKAFLFLQKGRLTKLITKWDETAQINHVQKNCKSKPDFLNSLSHKL